MMMHDDGDQQQIITTAKKRPLEQARPEFVARGGDDGAYHVLEMPKRLRSGGPVSANPRRQLRSHLLASDASGYCVDGGGEQHAETTKKRAVELKKPEFAATGKDGAYNIVEMPKRFRSLVHIDGEDARATAVGVRGQMFADALLRDLRAKAQAPGAANS